MGTPTRTEDKTVEREVKLTKKVASFFLGVWSVVVGIGQTMIALILCSIIGLAAVKSVELCENAKMEVDAQVHLLQR